MNALSNYIEPAHVAFERGVETEIERLTSDPTWEPNKRVEVCGLAQSLRYSRLDCGISWTYALEGVPCAPTWDRKAFHKALMQGDLIEVGRLIRDATAREFALNCVDAAEKAWENGTCF